MLERLPIEIAIRILKALVGPSIGGLFGLSAGWVIAVAMYRHANSPWQRPNLFWQYLLVYTLCIASGVVVGIALACWCDLPEEDLPS